MTTHGKPILSLRSIADMAMDKEALRDRRAAYRFKKHMKRVQAPLDEKMKIPAYAAAVEFNRKHGIGPKTWKHEKSILPPGEKSRQRYMNVSLPAVSIPVAGEVEGNSKAKQSRERAKAEERLVALIRQFVASAQFNLQQLQDIGSNYAHIPAVNVLKVHNVLFELTHKAGIKFTAEEMDFCRKVKMDAK